MSTRILLPDRMPLFLPTIYYVEHQGSRLRRYGEPDSHQIESDLDAIMRTLLSPINLAQHKLCASSVPAMPPPPDCLSKSIIATIQMLK